VAHREALKPATVSAVRGPHGKGDHAGRLIDSIAKESRPQRQASLSTVTISCITVPPDRLRKLRPEKVDELADSIRERGQIEPIVLRRLEDGRLVLLAGRQRLEARKKLNEQNINAIVIDGLDDDEAKLIEIDENLIRADLSPAEQAIHLAERKRLYEKAHPKTKHGGDRKSGSSSQNENLKSFAADTAEKTGKGRSTIAREVARAKIAGLEGAIGTDLDAGDQLDALAKLPGPVQRDLIARAKAGEKVDAKVEVMKARRCQREQELAEGTKAASESLGKSLYGVLYVDCPWPHSNTPFGDPARQAEQHYPVMTLADIKTLAVPAADNCVLFLWATVPMMPEAIEVMRAWGFQYKSALFWIKDRNGIGYWVRNRVEILLIGTRGNVPTPAPGEQPPQVIEAPRGRHSEKPAAFAEVIEKLYPSTAKLEMFARQARPDWDVWGNEVNQQTDQKPNQQTDQKPVEPDDAGIPPRGRIAKLKAKQSGATTRMPATGKPAIKAGKRGAP
jgi:N6-adenosine-specific RNA methylase IME4